MAPFLFRCGHCSPLDFCPSTLEFRYVLAASSKRKPPKLCQIGFLEAGFNAVGFQVDAFLEKGVQGQPISREWAWTCLLIARPVNLVSFRSIIFCLSISLRQNEDARFRPF